MPHLTSKEFADLCGVSGAAITKAITNNRIVRHDKFIDTDDPVNQKYYSDQVKKSEPKQKSQEKQQKLDKIGRHSIPISTLNIEPGEDQALPGQEKITHIPSSGGLVEIDGITMPVANLQKVIAMTRKTNLEVELKRKEFVPRKLVTDLFSRLVVIDQNEFMTLKDKLIPDIAAIFGVTDPDKLTAAGKRMDEELWKVLDHIKIEVDRWLERVGVETQGVDTQDDTENE